MLYKKNWAETREKWVNYWKQQNTGRPLMHVLARKDTIEPLVDTRAPGGVNDSIICQGRYYTLPEE
ncbi:MAG: trimethylamine corrinoid protein 2, partial [Clostridia bacterium]|nr:trimethylamine corrinoid protein 2 [Clostridia bacterium]